MAIQQNYSPGIDVNIYAICAMFSWKEQGHFHMTIIVMFPTQHLMFIILDSKYVLVSFTEFSQTIEDGGFARVLEAKDPNDHEVSVVRHEVCNSIAENMILINKFNRLSQSGLTSFTDNTLIYNFTI